jgi:hypothetical protein
MDGTEPPPEPSRRRWIEAPNPKSAKKAKADKADAAEAPATEAGNKKHWWTPTRIEPGRRLSETATAVRKRNRRRAEALSVAKRADLVRELRGQGLNADQIEEEMAKRQGQEVGR